MKHKLITVAALALPLVFAACEETVLDETKIGNTSPTLPEVTGDASGITTEVFGKLDLAYPGLEKVRECYEDNNLYGAAYELLEYYRTRSSVFNPAVDLINPTITATQQRIADQALEHRFYINNTYVEGKDENGNAIYYSYGNPDIDWSYLPIENDQEIMYQIHRHNWMEYQALAYKVSGNEEYVTSWIDTYKSWVETFPCPVGTVFPDAGGSENNVDYQWKGLQPASRVLSQVKVLPYVILSENITPEYLTWFLNEFEKHVECIRLNYYNESNILITQAQAVTNAGTLMPEFKASKKWRDEGYGTLAGQLESQFLADGVHYELDPSYHIAAIADLREIYELAQANSMTSAFPAELIARLESAAEFVMDITFPDWSIDNFNDTRASSYSKSVLLRNFKQYAKLFPSNSALQWMASEGKSGVKPDYTVKEYKTAGYYIIRNGWDSNSTVIVLKNNYNPENMWHCQPDNGTFALWHKGRNFLPDAGVYAYNGSSRTNYAATRNHNTLTVNAAVIDGNHRLGEFVASGENWVSTSNQHTDNVKFTRRVQLEADDVTVIFDEASGNTAERLNDNFHLVNDESNPNSYEKKDNGASVHTNYADGNNMYLETFVVDGTFVSADQRDSDISNAIGKVSGKRIGYRVNIDKAEGGAARFITVAVPFSKDVPAVSFEKTGDNSVSVTINGKTTNYNI